MLRIFGLANMSFSTHDNVCSHVFLYVEKGDIDHMILVHVAFFRKFKMCKGLDGQEVCHPLRFYSMFLECNNIRARLKPNELSGRSPHSFTVASFDRSFHTACRVSMCEYHQCCGFG